MALKRSLCLSANDAIAQCNFLAASMGALVVIRAYLLNTAPELPAARRLQLHVPAGSSCAAETKRPAIHKLDTHPFPIRVKVGMQGNYRH